MFAANGEDQTSTAETELQERKLRDILNYLVSAGYFRARQSKLSAFEKVVGGMCWCITHAHASIDVDVIFRGDKATTGQNIKLAEEIVHCIRQLGCPAPLQAHQITRGHDWVGVHPVIAWLIKLMFEAKKMGSALRLFSEQQFDKFGYELGDKPQPREPTPCPERKFRFAGDPTSIADEESAVLSCLLEYGDRNLARKVNVFEKGGDRKLEQAMQMAEKDEEKERGREQEAANMLQSAMREQDAKPIAGAKQVGQMVRLGAGEIAQAAKKYEVAKAQGGSSGGSESALEREAVALEQRLVKARAALKNASVTVEKLTTAYKEQQQAARAVKAELNEQAAYEERVKTEIRKLAEMEKQFDASKRRDLQELKSLVAQNETAKRREKDFKESCKRQRDELQKELKEVAVVDDTERLAEIEAMHAKVMAKDGRLRRQVAVASRKLASTARLIDDVPTRTELVQYERRFNELYAQVATKLDETRKYYELYNSLDEIVKIHKKEVSILNSIIDNYQQAMRSKTDKQTFLTQLDEMNAGLRKQLTTKKSALQAATDKYQTSAARHQHLLDQHRNYHTAVKEFHDACQKNDLLLAKLQAIGAST